jgi:hypothetical protein
MSLSSLQLIGSDWSSNAGEHSMQIYFQCFVILVNVKNVVSITQILLCLHVRNHCHIHSISRIMYDNVFDNSKYYVHVSSYKYGDNLNLCDLKRSYFCATHQDGIFFYFVYL